MSSNQNDGSRRLRNIQMFSPYVSEKAIERAVKTLRSGYIGEGPVVKEFEEKFKGIVKAPYALALNSGTTALHLALVVAGVQPGDEVITTAQTMMATSHAILAQFAVPVFADINFLTANINPADIEHRITPKTKAIIVVHWAGYPCDMEEINAIGAKHGLAVIEDAAHAIGAIYKGNPIGSISPFTCFSFQAIKHITTGDGGMLCLTDEKNYHQGRRQRWYAIDRLNRKPALLGEPEWNVCERGFKYHMNDIAASLGVENLDLLGPIIERRCQMVAIYREELANVPGITLLESKPDRTSAHWLFTLHVEKRNEFAKMMQAKGVNVSIVHGRIDTNDIFGGLRDDLPELKRFNESQIALPLHDKLSDDDVDYVIQCIKEGWQ